MAKLPVGKSSGKTPGAVLEKYIKDYNLSTKNVVLELGQNSTTFKKLLDGSKRITVELALLLAKKFDTTAEFWIDLQTKASLAEAKSDPKFQQRLKGVTKAEKKPKPAAKTAKTVKPAAKAAKPAAKTANPAAKTVKSAAETKKAPGRKPGRPSAAKVAIAPVKVTDVPLKKRGQKSGKKPPLPLINPVPPVLK
jgi:addiction module HigA family antidote